MEMEFWVALGARALFGERAVLFLNRRDFEGLALLDQRAMASHVALVMSCKIWTA